MGMRMCVCIRVCTRVCIRVCIRVCTLPVLERLAARDLAAVQEGVELVGARDRAERVVHGTVEIDEHR